MPTVGSPPSRNSTEGAALVEIDGGHMMLGLRGALSWLEANEEEVNELNVYPVPDGDTGSNMHLTLRAAVEEAERATDNSSAASVAAAAARGSLLGARGNSGVILSQILRGFAQGLENHGRVDAAGVAHALRRGVEVAYRAVIKPTEGTILTVVTQAADAARLAAEENKDIRVLFLRAAEEAHTAVDRTIDQLDVLREAGVVDAGGFGLAVILDGFAKTLSTADASLASTAAPVPRHTTPHVRLPNSRDESPSKPVRGAAAVAERERGWGHCTEFLVHGPGLDVDRLRQELSDFGESALVVGDSEMVRVHVHTENPSALIEAAAQRGRLSQLKVEDMSAQHHEVIERSRKAEGSGEEQAVVERAAWGVVAVASGDGFRDILTGLGANRIVEGGQSMNPSIEDVLTAVLEVGTPSVIVLPNNNNVVLTAQQVGALADGVDVRVVPTRNLPQAISALLTLDMGRDAAESAARMEQAMQTVTTVEVTRAVRDSAVNGLKIAMGDVIALVDDEITQVGDDYQQVVDGVLRNLEEQPSLVTVYWGAEVQENQAGELLRELQQAHPAVEFELHHGGQAHYPYVLSIE